MPKQTYKWVWIAGAALLLLALAFASWRWYREGFEDVTGRKRNFVVQASLSTLTSLANQNKIGSVQTGAYDTKYAVATITDYKGTEVWKAGQSPSTDETKKQYRLNFPNDITVSGSENAGTPGTLATRVDVFAPKLVEKGIPATDISYVGDDFTSDYIIIETTPDKIVDPYIRGEAGNQYKGILSSFGGVDEKGQSIVVGRASTDYAATRIVDSADIVYYDKSASVRQDYRVTFSGELDVNAVKTFLDQTPAGTKSTLSEDDIQALELRGTDYTDTRTAFNNVRSTTVVFTGPLSAILSEGSLKTLGSQFGSMKPTKVENAARQTVWADPVAPKRFRVNFAKQINLRVAAQQISRKISGAKYIGLSFTDTPAAGPAADEFGIRRNLGAAAQIAATDRSVRDAIIATRVPEQQFPSTFLASGENAGSSDTANSATTTQDTTYRDVKATGTDFSGYFSTMTPATNRFRVRAKWSVLSKPGMIATLSIAAGKLEDGTYPKVVEILNLRDQKIWPEGSPGAIPYVDTGVTELFTIGYDVTIDPKISFETYVQTYIPSIAYVNPAMPRA